MDQSKHSQGVTSVKVKHQPGGASTFNFMSGYEEPKPVVPKAAAVVTVPEANPAEENKDEEVKVEAPAAGQKKESASVEAVQKSQVDAAGNPVVTSVRVKQPPGGKSSISFF